MNPRLRALSDPRRRRLVASAALVLLWCGASAFLALWFAGRIRDWSVMTDELLYAKLATAIAETGSPLPQVHGSSISVYNQLYPLLIAPFYGALSPPDAFRAAHVLNAVVMASAAFPAYLLGRQVLPRVWSLAVAALSVLVPWMVLTGFLMTESAAYPAFLWAILGLQVAIADPSPRRDVLAVGAIGLAVLARTQFAALGLVLPLAILGHELGRERNLVEGVRQAVRRHRLLAALYATGAVAAAIVAVAGSLGGVLGVYSVTVEGSILPSSVWSGTAEHIDAVGIGCGLVPLILGGGWMLATVVRPRDPREHAFACLGIVTVAVLAVEATSFAVRFGRSEVVYDRYLFYVVPLLLVGAAAALVSGAPRRIAAGAGLVTILFAASVSQLSFTTYPGINVDSAVSVLNEVLIDQSGSLGTGTFAASLVLLVGLVLVLGVLLAPRIPLALVVFAALCVFSILTLRSEVDRILDGTGLSGRPLAGPPGLVLEWVDTVVPEGDEAALVPFPISTAWDTTAIRWWDVEFWNRRVVRAYVAQDGNFSYTPYRHGTLAIDWTTGAVAGTSAAPRYVVAAPRDPRFLLSGREHADNLGFVVREVDRPYRAVWASRGLQSDGWTTPGRPATIRVYGRPGGRRGLLRARIVVRSPATAPARYRLTAQGTTRSGALPTDTERRVFVPVCVPARSFVDIAVTGSSRARIGGVQLSPDVDETRSVGVLVGPISVRQTGRACGPASP
jgi:hypothetical protein